VTYSEGGAYRSDVVALDEGDGHIVWGPIYLGSTSRLFTAPAYDGGRLFVLDSYCTISSFDADTGALLWRVMGNSPFRCTGAPTASDGVVYIHSGNVLAYRETDGHLLWTSIGLDGSKVSPSVTNEAVIVDVAGVPFNIYALSRSDGHVLWHVGGGWGGGGRTVPVAGGRVFARGIGSDSGRILDVASGAELGQFASKGMPAVDGSVLFELVEMDGHTVDCPVRACKLQATNVDNQTTLWSFVGDGRLITPPLVVNGVVYIGSNTGNVFGLAENTGQLLWSAYVGGHIGGFDEQNTDAPPTAMGAADGLVIVSALGRVVAYTSVAAGTVSHFDELYEWDNSGECPNLGTAFGRGCSWSFDQVNDGRDVAHLVMPRAIQATLEIADAGNNVIAQVSGSSGDLVLDVPNIVAGSGYRVRAYTPPDIQYHVLGTVELQREVPPS
jgi:outer membrane protein assembly factor BamB